MPLIDATAENAALDACYGDGHAASWPSEFEVHLWDDDPRDVGERLAEAGGYAPATVTNDTATFPDAVGGEKTSAMIDFGTSTDAWDATARWATLEADGVIYEAVEIPDGVTVTAADVSVQVQLVFFHEDTE